MSGEDGIRVLLQEETVMMQCAFKVVIVGASCTWMPCVDDDHVLLSVVMNILVNGLQAIRTVKGVEGKMVLGASAADDDIGVENFDLTEQEVLVLVDVIGHFFVRNRIAAALLLGLDQGKRCLQETFDDFIHVEVPVFGVAVSETVEEACQSFKERRAGFPVNFSVLIIIRKCKPVAYVVTTSFRLVLQEEHHSSVGLVPELVHILSPHPHKAVLGGYRMTVLLAGGFPLFE